ncbi:hypothetical protein HUU62_23160 [Rhodoferax sp. 4810]|uniref:ParD-like antitoxin of type II toxin-antitoxin system n=1 Tax=Thiospirillum jenense TaxID=1653858 RepID=A0A839HJB9_9GAMM|nr:hypothetical protein [Thiospirillum jenense]MBB1077309.1 hypothetical protein [Rhodoferax jenense]MBB1127076.1 hypothetical protein [Thiospirillum jenense]
MKTVAIYVNDSLVDAARFAAEVEYRTVPEQLAFWARVGRAALENPDLPAPFIAECLMAMNEATEEAIPYCAAFRN